MVLTGNCLIGGRGFLTTTVSEKYELRQKAENIFSQNKGYKKVQLKYYLRYKM